MATTRSAARDGRPPLGFAAIRDILDAKVRKGTLANVLGVVTDFRAPIPTGGPDWKCQVRIFDQSVENEPDHSIALEIFWPQNDMPDVRCGDVVIVFRAKVQTFREAWSLCSNYMTDVYVYDSSKIPKPIKDASRALRPSTRKKSYRPPSKVENEFVSVLHSSINKERLPTATEFEVMKINSTNVKKKFSELKDVRDGKFVDTVAQIVREPYDLGDKYTLWISDYTENPLFYHYQLMGGRGQGGDPDGHANKFGTSPSSSEWSGPFGKLSLQVTCFEPHASVIRKHKLTVGAWLSLRNMQIKFGHNNVNLEGYVREDREAPGKINVSQEQTHDSEATRPELKSALRRKRDYEKVKKEQLHLLTEAATAGAKRRAEIDPDSERPSKSNGRAKRKAIRAPLQQAYKEKQKQANGESPPTVDIAMDAPTDLNIQGKSFQPQTTHRPPLTPASQVKCENGNKPATPLEDMIKLVFHETIIDDNSVRLPLPFVNANYRTYASIVDFMPSRLEDFACPKKVPSEYAALSDHEESDSGSTSESESENEQEITPDSTKIIKEWEWRFYLRLEDVSQQDGQPKNSLWALVDNKSAQMLLSLDASDLRNDDRNLGRLRQTMFILWGELEEHKAQLENRALQSRPVNGTGPPADSDDEGDVQTKLVSKQTTFSNRPFACCIRQYGVQMKEKDDTKSDAGQGKRWERMFGLFGTKISGCER
ncbi:hypothetical protein QQS21_011804 [Conoideocrella luteorostrata]|uniref:Protection of telomeres protein 1 n=1 Tax=Conoideocrella luteorostrata TaxID=1105319 RepID=A0AAJ0FTC3_9HYPO|nr:hypothetical protein QQS21_011804 [Conoideocrella luteorostrata]